LTDYTSQQIKGTIQDPISEKSVISGDKSSSYINISDYVELHLTKKPDKQTKNLNARFTSQIAMQNEI
jgi:hypothetical protein